MPFDPAIKSLGYCQTTLRVELCGITIDNAMRGCENAVKSPCTSEVECLFGGINHVSNRFLHIDAEVRD